MLVSVRPRADRRVTFGTKRNRYTYNIANLRGFRDNTGNKAKHMTKQTRAAALQAPKTSRRSHRLTIARVDRQPGVLMSSNADETGKCIEGMQLKDSACDDNGRAGASVRSVQRLWWQDEGYEAYPTHVQTTLPLPLFDWEQAMGRRGPLVSVTGHSLSLQKG